MRGFHYTTTDLQLHVLFQELQGLVVNRPSYRSLFGLDAVAEHTAVWQGLEAEGWVTVDAETIRVIGDGVFYLPIIQNLLAHDRNEAMRKSRSAEMGTVSYTPVEQLAAGPAAAASVRSAAAITGRSIS